MGPPKRRREIAVDDKICTKCHTEKPLECFYFRDSHDGYNHMCKQCILNRCFNRSITVHGALMKLQGDARRNIRKRENRGRQAGTLLSIEELQQIYDQQRGCCYYFKTKKMALIPYSQWKLSLERIDPISNTYARENCALCCIEFNVQHQWSWLKIKEMLALYDAPDPDLVKLLEEINKPGKEQHAPRCDNPEHERYDKVENRKEGTVIAHPCRTCRRIGTRQRYTTPRGFLYGVLGRMNSNSRKYKRQCDMTIEELIEIITRQGVRCAISGIPLIFASNSNWMCSPERVDPTQNYTKDNVVLICCEFNSSCNRDTKARHTNESKIGKEAQWTKEKFLEWKGFLDEAPDIIERGIQRDELRTTMKAFDGLIAEIQQKHS